MNLSVRALLLVSTHMAGSARTSIAHALQAESLLWSSARDGRQPPLVVLSRLGPIVLLFAEHALYVRTGYAHQPPACCTHRRHRAAWHYCTYAVRVLAFAVPHAPRTVGPQVMVNQGYPNPAVP